MGYFNVLKPCVVGKLHYATLPGQPIEVDDDVAAPLVESGDLETYGAQRISAEERAEVVKAFFGDEPTQAVQIDGGEIITIRDEPKKLAAGARGRRKATED